MWLISEHQREKTQGIINGKILIVEIVLFHVIMACFEKISQNSGTQHWTRTLAFSR